MLKRITTVRMKRFLATLPMTGKVSGSQVPNSPEGEKQGWPVKVVRAGEGGSGFWRERFLTGLQGGGPGRKNREAGGRMTLTRLLLPFGRLQKEGPRRTEANTNEQ